MKIQAQQQLKVLAHYSDGATRDVTRTALYEPNDKGMAEVERGRAWSRSSTSPATWP